MKRNSIISLTLAAFSVVFGVIFIEIEPVVSRIQWIAQAFYSLSNAQPIPTTIGVLAITLLILAMGVICWRHFTETSGLRDARTSRYFEDRGQSDYKTQFEKLIKNAKNIDVIGIGNSQFTTDVTEKFYSKALLKNRTSFRLLFLDPDGTQVKVRERDENHHDGLLSNQVIKHTSYLNEYINSVCGDNPVAQRLINFKFYDKYPVGNIIIFDHKTILVQHYSYSIRGSASPIFMVSGEDSWMVKFYNVEFEKLWTEARLAIIDNEN